MCVTSPDLWESDRTQARQVTLRFEEHLLDVLEASQPWTGANAL